MENSQKPNFEPITIAKNSFKIEPISQEQQATILNSPKFSEKSSNNLVNKSKSNNDLFNANTTIELSTTQIPGSKDNYSFNSNIQEKSQKNIQNIQNKLSSVNIKPLVQTNAHNKKLKNIAQISSTGTSVTDGNYKKEKIKFFEIFLFLFQKQSISF